MGFGSRLIRKEALVLTWTVGCFSDNIIVYYIICIMLYTDLLSCGPIKKQKFKGEMQIELDIFVRAVIKNLPAMQV